MANREMKDSGIEWIGRIPINWKISKVKHIAYIQGGSGFPAKLQGKNNGKYPFYKNSDFSNNGRNLIYANNYVDDRDVIDSKLNIIPTGSIVMSKIGESMKKNHRKITTEPSVVDNNLQALILKGSKKLSLIFFYYLMSIIDSNWFDNKGTVPSINNNLLRHETVYLPNIEEQQKIATFLDEKVSHIDNIIEDTKKSIENLKTYKQSLITETITKGLDPNVEMKDSGIDRIGGIPLHWKLKKLKYILSNEKNSIRVGPFGSHLKNNDFVEEGKWVYNQRIVLDNNYNSNDTFITEGKYKEMHAFKVEYKDILLTTRGTIGKISRVPKQFKEGIIHSSVIKFRLDESKFTYGLLEYLFNESSFIKEQILQLSNATTIEVIYSNTLKNVLIPVPSLEEQDRIICFLDEKITKLNTILEEKEFLISELESYKKSLIYEYVTGKKEVK
ncbi:restriction endonuclease subunit S [Aerococcus urinaeequi]|uniref:restriction endonuclease subunit S n=1 Tax=Aerococcus urinaeequi TaxID=51665 RepID=UPI003D6A7C6E